MAITDSQRRNIFASLESAHGEDVADHIMQLLPNQPADQLVTRTDMHAFGAELRGEMAELRSDVRVELAELRSDINERFATAKVDTQRLIVAGMAANTIAVVTALLT